jgi:hypothetical protein
MAAWLDLFAGLVVALILTFSCYQFCQYCREARLNIIACLAKLYRKFLDELRDSFTNNPPGPRR